MGFHVRLDGGTPIDVGDLMTHTFTGLTPGVEYSVDVRQYDAPYLSDWCEAETITLPGVSPLLVSAIQAGGANDNTTGAIDTTGVTLLVAAVARTVVLGNASAPLTDSEGNTWSPLTEYSGGNGRLKMYYCIAPTTDAAHTFTMTGVNSYGGIAVAGFTGFDTYDTENGAGDTLEQFLPTGSVTPAIAGSLVVTGLQYVDEGLLGDASINSGFTLIDSLSSATTESIAMAYRIQPASAVNPTWTSPYIPHDMSAGIAVFSPV